MKTARLVFIASILCAAAVGVWWRASDRRERLPYSDHFASGSLAEWKAYGGSWQISDGVLQNNSDDTGAKLVTGSTRLKDYLLSSDVLLLNNYGDAGVMLRVQQPEEGTNAFLGYYVGVRLPDRLLLGQMDYGYVLLAESPVPGGVKPGVWYHLAVSARDCRIRADLSIPGGALVAHLDSTAQTCLRDGSFGLRSFAAGGSWRRVRVEALP